MAYFENSVNQKNHDYHHEQNLSNTSASTIENMKNWPLSLSIELSSKKCLFVHGTREEPTIGYCYPDSKIMESDYDFVFMGNTHRPFIRAAGRTTYVNVGSIGLPRDDGRYASFCIFDPEDGSVKILRYSIENSNMDLLKKYPEISIEVREVFNRREKFFRSETGPN
jgi:predicted phosphodiesterase